MRAAQSLYEGVEVPGEGPVGLITYMRTDSTHLSRRGDRRMARGYIGKHLRRRYLPEKPNFYAPPTRTRRRPTRRSARPTWPTTPERVRSALASDQFKLYQLIWERFVACQMTPAQWDSTSVLIEGGADGRSGPRCLPATGPGARLRRLLPRDRRADRSDEQTCPPLTRGQPLAPFAIDPEQKFTSPPPRYTEASLIKKLESEGIGRPSTYASIIR
jgi:DNA topoisomerase I